jgi:gluconate kinase
MAMVVARGTKLDIICCSANATLTQHYRNIIVRSAPDLAALDRPATERILPKRRMVRHERATGTSFAPAVGAARLLHVLP